MNDWTLTWNSDFQGWIVRWNMSPTTFQQWMIESLHEATVLIEIIEKANGRARPGPTVEPVFFERPSVKP